MPIAFVLLNVEPGTEEEVLKELRKLNEVREAYRVYGVYDGIVKVSADTTEKVKEMVSSEIRRLPNVKSTFTMIVAE